ncbi:MAG: hypothetical protein CM15mP51_22390 [Porticoccaceae bacterium]|nr:MAG: hypothetical protein CM15mP51_22390 [Porticoccaceae bacterium]
MKILIKIVVLRACFMMSKEFIKVMGNRQSFSRLFDPPPDTKLMKDILVASLRSPIIWVYSPIDLF